MMSQHTSQEQLEEGSGKVFELCFSLCVCLRASLQFQRLKEREGGREGERAGGRKGERAEDGHGEQAEEEEEEGGAVSLESLVSGGQ